MYHVLTLSRFPFSLSRIELELNIFSMQVRIAIRENYKREIYSIKSNAHVIRPAE